MNALLGESLAVLNTPTMKNIHMYCIGHQPTAFEVPGPFTHVSSHAFDGLNQLIIPDDSLGANFHGRILSEYTQLFGLLDHIEHLDPEDSIYIFQYRKFVALQPPPTLSTNIAAMYVCTAQAAPGLFPSAEELKALTGHALIGALWNIQDTTVASFFTVNHHMEDFCSLVATLAMLEDFDPPRLRDFIYCNKFFPAPSLGMTKVATFRAHMQLLKSAWRLFQAHYFQERGGYQRRVGGFLLERLHSYLVYESVFKQQLPMAQGYTTVVSESDNITVTV
jgi:hypothetical protein